MPQPLNVSPSQLQTASSNFMQLLGEMQQRLNGLDAFMEERVRTWDGQSKVAYSALNREWREGAAQLNQVGQEFAQAISASGRSFSAAEERNLEAISRTRRNFS